MDIQDAQRESSVCLHWRLLGTACQFRNLAGVRGAGHLGHSKGVYSDRRHRGIFSSFRSTQMMLRLSGRRASVSTEKSVQ